MSISRHAMVGYPSIAELLILYTEFANAFMQGEAQQFIMDSHL